MFYSLGLKGLRVQRAFRDIWQCITVCVCVSILHCIYTHKFSGLGCKGVL